MDAAGRKEVIDELCSIEGRGPGTDAERRAAKLLAGRLQAMGRKVDVEPTYVHPNYALVHAINLTLAVAGSLLATSRPAIGFAMVLLAATSFYLDHSTRLYLVRSLLFRRASQNLVSRGDRPDAPTRVILSAHYDAAPTGYVFGERSLRLARRLSERARLLLGPWRVIFWGCLAPLLPVLGLRMAGIDANWVSILQVVPTVLLILAVFLLIDIALSEIVPAAYDNASGVAAVLSIADDLRTTPAENLDVWIVLPGSEESLDEGMRAFVRRHRKELDKENTVFINVDSVSYGTPHYQVAQGPIITYPMDPELVEFCEAIATAEPRYGARPVRVSLSDDATPVRVRGYRVTSICGLQEGLPPPWYHTHEDTPDKVDGQAMTKAVEFAQALVRLLDRDAARADRGS
jgi:hypothetical protein